MTDHLSLSGDSGFDWRGVLAEMYELFRELERARADLAAIRETNMGLRARLRRAEEAWATYDARARADSVMRDVDPTRLGSVMITFGTSRDDAVRVPTGPGNAQFLYGLVEILLRDLRPIFFEVERKRDGELRSVKDERKSA